MYCPPSTHPTTTQQEPKENPRSNLPMVKMAVCKMNHQRIQILTVECYEEYNTLAQGEV
jgi:hypothetical protein